MTNEDIIKIEESLDRIAKHLLMWLSFSQASFIMNTLKEAIKQEKINLVKSEETINENENN